MDTREQLERRIRSLQAQLQRLETSDAREFDEIPGAEPPHQTVADQLLQQHIDHSPLAVIEWDAQFRVLRWSKQAEAIFGWGSEDVLGRSWEELRFVHDDDLERVTVACSDLMSGAVKNNICLNRNYRRDGSVIHCEWFNSVIRNDDGGVRSLLSLANDVTERVRAEEALHENEALFREIVRDQSELIVRWRPNGVRTFCNESYCRFFGVSAKDVIGTSFFPVISEEDRDAVLRRIETLSPSNPVSTGVHRAVQSDGVEAWMEWTDRALYDDEGELLGYQSIGRDITQSRMIEDSLRRSESRFSLAVKGSLDGIWEWDLTTGKNYWSPRVFEQLGHSPTDFTPTFEAFLERLHPDDHARVRKAIERSHKTGERYLIGMRIKMKDGDYRWFRSSGATEFDADGRAVRMCGVLQDIHDQQAAEDELRRSQRQYQDLVENMQDVVYRYEFAPTPRFAYVSPSVTAMTGYTPEEHYAEPDLPDRIIHPDDRDLMERGIENESFDEPTVMRWIKRDGSIIWTEQRNRPIRNDAGQLVAIEGIGRDITEQKLAEISIQESEARFRSLIDHAPEAVVLLDCGSGDIVMMNPAAKKLFKCDGSMPEFRTLHPPTQPDGGDSLARAEERMQRAREGETAPFEWVHCDADGKEIPCEVRLLWLEIEGRELIRGSITDISERKAAEKEREESEARFRAAVDSNPAVMMLVDVETRTILGVNQAYERTMGIRRNEVVGVDGVFGRAIVDENDRERIIETVRESGRISDYETTIRSRDGRELVVLIYAEPITLQGRRIHIVTSVDVTERNRAERALQRRLEFETLLSRISSPLINLPIDEIDAAITNGLRMIAEFIGVDRATIARLDRGRYRVLNEWSAEGVPDLFGDVREFSIEHFPWARERWLHGEVISISSMSELPQEAAAERETLEATGSKSLLSIPVIIGGQVWGCVEFDTFYEEREWSRELINQHRLVSGFFASAFERQRAEADLRGTQAILTAAIEASPEGIIIADAPTGNIRSINSAAMGIRGADRHQLADIPFELHPERWQCSHPDGTPYRPEDLPLTRAILEGKISENVDVIIERGDGEKRWVLGNAAPVRDEEGRIVGGVVVFPDVTELKRAEAELRKLNAELEQRVAERTAELSDAVARIEESERQLSAILENTSTLIGLLDTDGTVMRVNNAVTSTLGFAEADWLGKPLWRGPQWVLDEHRTAVKEAIDRARDGLQTRTEITHLDVDGRQALFDFSISPIFDADGDVVMMVPEGRDISELKRIEQYLRESEEKYRRLVEDLSDDFIVYSLSPEGRYSYVSPSFTRLVKLNELEMLNRHWSEVMGEWIEDASAGENAVQLCLAGEAPGPFEVALNLPNYDEPLYFEVHQRPVFDPQGQVVAVTGIARNITVFRNAEAALLEAKEQAESADRVKSAFLATMSHELRTPLNSIIGFTGILLMGIVGDLSKEQQKQLRMVEKSAKHLLSLINDILDISKIEAGQFRIHRRPFDLADVVHKSAEMMAPMAEAKGLTIECDVKGSIAEITNDRRRVEQVLINLLSNAVKFTESGEVRLQCEGQNGGAVVRVVDTGIGISSEDQADLFQPFMQLEHAGRVQEGTGLGLAISSRLVQLMGGRISVKSELGKGSAFEFRLPSVSDEH